MRTSSATRRPWSRPPARHGIAARRRARPLKRGPRPPFALPGRFLRNLAEAIRARLTTRSRAQGAAGARKSAQHHGIRRIHYESRYLLAEHIQRTQLSFVALLAMSVMQLLLVGYLVRDIMQPMRTADGIFGVLPNLAVVCCLIPFTCFLARMHAGNRRDVSRVRDRVTAIESYLQSSVSNGIHDSGRL